MIKKVFNKLTPLILFFMFILSIVALFSHFGINTSNSVGFTFYTHNQVHKHKVTLDSFVLFEIPDNQLFDKGSNVVKMVACMPNQHLTTVQNDNGSIAYLCDNKVISTLTLFETSKGEKLTYKAYNGIVPEDSYFMIGTDKNSYDSKYWGFVPYADIKRIVYPIAFVKSAYANDGFYGSQESAGWYKYKDEVIAKDNETETTTEKKYPPVIMPDVPWERVSSMHVQEFKELFTQVEEVAMSDRTLQNFDTYARLRDVMFDRSTEFASVGSLWGQLNPASTNDAWYPTSGYGQNVLHAEQTRIRRDYLSQNRDRFGLLYFYKVDCKYCAAQAPIVQYFESETGWPVKYIDGDQSPDGMQRFGVTTVPAIILVDRNTQKSLPIASGITTADEIEERLYKTIKYIKGETDERNFAKSIRPVQ